MSQNEQTYEGQCLLRCRQDRRHRRGGGCRLLPLRRMQELVGRTGQRVHAVEV